MPVLKTDVSLLCSAALFIITPPSCAAFLKWNPPPSTKLLKSLTYLWLWNFNRNRERRFSPVIGMISNLTTSCRSNCPVFHVSFFLPLQNGTGLSPMSHLKPFALQEPPLQCSCSPCVAHGGLDCTGWAHWRGGVRPAARWFCITE